eukprot:TRINITY_DN3957_c0_g1_i2.p1 TRINITY_DN3957_c0_g1~~TRINITY_DN3957_c0_g1_i2.p1  ORF type:complete len:161 (+),score=46.17 TRINITY_DN3957_c0_g1_i2:78-560(+)
MPGCAMLLYVPPPALVTAGFVNKDTLRIQLESYFSTENLVRDIYLRKQMDPNGYVALDVITAFPRMRQLGADVHLLEEVARGCPTLELLCPPTTATTTAATATAADTTAPTDATTNPTANPTATPVVVKVRSRLVDMAVLVLPAPRVRGTTQTTAATVPV